MAFIALSRMTILDVNYIMSKTHTWGISGFTTVTGYGTDMLDDDDATTEMRSNTITGQPIISCDFGVAWNKAISGLGICNHNMRTAGSLGFSLDRSPDNSNWTTIGTYLFPDWESDAAGNDPNRDLAIVFTPETYRYWRLVFTPTPSNAFHIGYIYLGTYWQFYRNPSDGGWVQTRTPNTRYIETMGGLSHAIKGSSLRPARLEMTFGRAKAVDIARLQGVNKTDYIIGVIPPEAVPGPSIAPRGADVFWGRMGPISIGSLTPGNIVDQTEVYNTTISMVGALGGGEG